MYDKDWEGNAIPPSGVDSGLSPGSTRKRLTFAGGLGREMEGGGHRCAAGRPPALARSREGYAGIYE